ncbi:MAG TPA: hypothetical protein VGK52_14275 [Polyangia bacterium]|jgi:hypothetical protein
MSDGGRGAPVAGLVVAAAGVLVVVPFFAATTFLGDDHLFLAFARLAPNPLVAFVRDQHGGEFYRPLPMLAWWLLAHATPVASSASSFPASWPFAALALGLHALSALLLGRLLVALGRPLAVARVAAALFFLAPQNLDAASWYAASTDLFATAFTLAALLALARGASPVSTAALALAAFVSKESALVLPALAYVVLGARAAPEPRGRRLRAVLPSLVAAALALLVRARVLGGWGGPGDERASPVAKLAQLANGLVHVGTGAAVLPEILAWGLGAAALALFGLAAARARRPAPWVPLAFTAVALLPLLGPGWIVGARYFYLPSVGLAWAAAEALAERPLPARVTIGAALLLLGALQATARRSEIVRYEARLASARRAVADGAQRGARVFHVDGGIKDIDLAVKEAPALAPLAGELLVLGDVPASFVELPPALAARAAFLVAAPPLPPSGAYTFGDARIVGLARRGADPTLDEVVARFPDIRFIRLRLTPAGRVVGRDVTEELEGSGD